MGFCFRAARAGAVQLELVVFAAPAESAVNASGIPVVAIDLPSGLSADSHEPIGDSIDAAMTVTLAAPKLALVLPPAETRAGDIVIADIGIPSEVIDTLDGPRVELLTRSAKTVALKLGSRGSMYVGSMGTFETAKPFKVRVVDSTAATQVTVAARL